jgi:uncharacterized membrane protein YjgN (DUF898 family)
MSDPAFSTAQGQPTPFLFEKRNGPLFKLFLKNLLLTVVTFGVYFFWARVSITKYIYNHLSFGKRSFDYHATGKEQFIGFLKGIGILGSLAVVFLLLIKLSPILAIILSPLMYIAAIFILAPFVIIGKWRFLLSRSSYCNVRFKCTGNFKEILPIWIKGVLLTGITFGFYSPVLQNKLQKYLVDKSQFGSLRFEYSGKNGEYFGIWLKGLLLTIVTLGIYGFWFMANINRYIMSHTSLNGRTFNSTVTGGALFKIAIINMLTVVFTFGLGFPIAVNRMYGYFFGNLTLDISPDELQAVAATFDTGASALATGIEDAAEVVDAIAGII